VPEFRKVADVYQGYNFKKDKQSTIGFVTKLNLGSQALTADQICKDPLNPDRDFKVVAVLSDILWDLGVTDPLFFSGQISPANRSAVAQLIQKVPNDTRAVFQFSVYEFDPIAKKYFACLHSGGVDLNGIIAQQGAELNLSAADQPSSEVQSPENFSFNIGLNPQPNAQAVQLAVAADRKFSKIWGRQAG
jgi:hypothetical protein